MTVAEKANRIAQVAHEVNRAYCIGIGDKTQVAWSDAPSWQRESAIAGVQLHLEAPKTPQQSHELWMDHKKANGWKFGAVKNERAKEHPCMVPYDKLPTEQKVKDYLFAAVVDQLKNLL